MTGTAGLYRWVRRAAIGGTAAAVMAVTVVGMAAPAGAVLNGACSGQGSLAKGTAASGKGPFAAESIPAGQVITVPISDDVAWSGSVSVPAGQRQISGFVALKLPWPFGDVKIDTWGGPSSKVANNGTKHYKLLSVLPRETVFKVFGQHHDANNVNCDGYVLLKIEGSAFATPLTAISLAVTAGLGLILLVLGRAKAGG